MPLTVCLVVLGRHIEPLGFIEVLLGDEPALEPHESFYQRLLAGDATEAADMAEKQLKKQSLSSYYDAVVMPALALAQTDAARGKLLPERQMEIHDTVEEVIEDLDEYSDEPTDEETGLAPIPTLDPAALPAAWRVEHPILCVASRSPLDQAACVALVQLLGKHGLSARVLSFADVASMRALNVGAADSPLVCLSYFGSAGNPAHVRYLTKRLHRAMPQARFLAGFWMLRDTKAEEWRAAVGADLAATSLRKALAVCVAEASARVKVADVPSADRNLRTDAALLGQSASTL